MEILLNTMDKEVKNLKNNTSFLNNHLNQEAEEKFISELETVFPKIRNHKEKYPRVFLNLVNLWGDKKFHDYLYELCLQEDNVIRQGFDIDFWDFLFQLDLYHQASYPSFYPKGKIEIQRKR